MNLRWKLHDLFLCVWSRGFLTHKERPLLRTCTGLLQPTFCCSALAWLQRPLHTATFTCSSTIRTIPGSSLDPAPAAPTAQTISAPQSTSYCRLYEEQIHKNSPSAKASAPNSNPKKIYTETEDVYCQAWITCGPAIANEYLSLSNPSEMSTSPTPYHRRQTLTLHPNP